MKYTCILRHGSRREAWEGELVLLHGGPGFYEAEANGRGTYFHLIAGRHKYGNYLCIPNHFRPFHSSLSLYQPVFSVM